MMNIRMFKPTDIEYVIQSHGDIYGKEYGFDKSFQDYVRQAIYQFLDTYNAEREKLVDCRK